MSLRVVEIPHEKCTLSQEYLLSLPGINLLSLCEFCSRRSLSCEVVCHHSTDKSSSNGSGVLETSAVPITPDPTGVTRKRVRQTKEGRRGGGGKKIIRSACPTPNPTTTQTPVHTTKPTILPWHGDEGDDQIETKIELFLSNDYSILLQNGWQKAKLSATANNLPGKIIFVPDYVTERIQDVVRSIEESSGERYLINQSYFMERSEIKKHLLLYRNRQPTESSELIAGMKKHGWSKRRWAEGYKIPPGDTPGRYVIVAPGINRTTPREELIENQTFFYVTRKYETAPLARFILDNELLKSDVDIIVA